MPVKAAAVRTQKHQAMALAKAAKTTWPRSSSADVAPRASEVRAGTTPVFLSAPQATRSAKASTAAASPARAKVHVAVADHAASARAGVNGVLISLTRADTAGGRSPVSVGVDYSSFAGAYGGDYAQRLRLVELPACALTTPGKPSCRTQRPLTTHNDTHSHRLTAQVTLSGPTATAPASSTQATAKTETATTAVAAPMVLAATSGTSGGGGTYSATSLGPSGRWSAGNNSGDFAWSEPIDVPQVPGGLQPGVALSYDSQSVDGRTSATNSQASWVGDGWDYSPGFIERSYKACASDTASGSPKTADQCWSPDDTVTLSLNGQSTELVHDDKTGAWVPQSDNGEKIELKTGAPNGDNDGEYWVVTTTDGTQYYFGLNQLPGWASGDATTNSAWTVPVYGNDAGEPCHASTFAASWCQQAWRWNLDYVVDIHQDTIAYWYSTEQNYYGRDLTTTATPYIRDGWLNKITYGQKDGQVYSTQAPAQIFFDTTERCLPDSSFDCAASKLTTANASHWPDVPFDQNCTSTQACSSYSPSFWTRIRLTGIRTQVLNGTTYQDVDSWALTQSFPATGDSGSPSMWLSSITHTGKDTLGGDTTTQTLPQVTFTGQAMPNRVADSSGLAPITRYRLTAVTTESGENIAISYAPAQCSQIAPVRMPTAPESNTLTCYPTYWTPDYETTPILDWFNKYPVTQVLEQDPTGGQPTQVTTYTYVGDPAWHYEDSPLTDAQYRTWSEWRGYGTVQIRTGAAPDPVTLEQKTFFRGMDGDTLPGSKTRTATVTDSRNGTVTDSDWLAGFIREDITYKGDGGPVLKDVITDPWSSAQPTASQARTGLPDLTAHLTGTAAVHSYGTKANGDTRTTEIDNTYDSRGRITAVSDLGDTSTNSDATCTRTWYADAASLGIFDLTARVQVVAAACDATPKFPDQAISDSETYYDGTTTNGAAPTHGDITRVDKADSVDANGTPHYVTNSTATYDSYGRALTATDADNRTTKTSFTPATGAIPTQTVTTNPAGYTTTTNLDPARGLPLSVIDTANYRTDETYDALGRLTAVWKPGQLKGHAVANIKYSYQVLTTAPSTVTTQTLADDGASYTTSVTLYDALMRPIQTQDQAPPPGNGRLISGTTYDTHGWTVKSTNAYYTDGSPSTTLVVPTNSDGTGFDSQVPSQTGYVYDGAGRQTAVIAYSHATETWHTTTAYPGVDRTDVTPPAAGTATTSINDARGRQTELWQYHTAAPTGNRADADIVSYAYNPAGQLATRTDAAGDQWNSIHNLLGQVTQTSDPDNGTTHFTYDPAGQLLTSTDADQHTLAFTYDALGRKTAEYSGSTTGTELASWTYDTIKKGYATSSTRYDAGLAYTIGVAGYDTHARPTGTKVVIPTSTANGALAGTYTTTYAYTGADQISTQTDPAVAGLPYEAIGYTYDSVGDPVTVGSTQGDYVDKLIYTEYGEPSQYTFGPSTNHAQLNLYYDDQTRNLTRSLTTTENTANGTFPTADDSSYTYQPGTENVTKITDAQSETGTTVTDTQCFTYDALQRLTTAWTATDSCSATPATGNASTIGGPQPYWQSWTYDALGNRKTQTDHNLTGDAAKDTVTTYDYPTPGAQTARPHALQDTTATGPGGTQTTSFGYDTAGNTKTITDTSGTETLTWSEENRLSSATLTGSNGSTSYVYDANGNQLLRRDPTSTTLYLGDTQLVLGSSGTVTGTRYYTLGGTTVAARTSDGKVSYLVPDRQGTSQLSIDSQTMSVTRREYTPFGTTRGNTPSSWPGDRGYVGGSMDTATGFEDLGAREYDPATGRFLSPDPLVVGSDPQQWTAYSYADNTPVTKSDPTGTRPDDCANGAVCAPDNHGGWYVALPGEDSVDENANGTHDATPDTPGTVVGGMYNPGGNAPHYKVWAKKQPSYWDLHAGQRRKKPTDFLHRVGNFLYTASGAKDVVDCATHPSWGSCLKAGAMVGAAVFTGGSDEALAIGLRGALDIGDSTLTHLAADGADETATTVADDIAENGASCLIGANSFIAATPILLADGTHKPISKAKVGDIVEATDPQTGTTKPEKVTAVIVTRTDKDFTNLTVHTPAGDRTITSTQHHPYWNATRHIWSNAADVHPGEKLRRPNGTLVTVTHVRSYHQHYITYNLTVTHLHTYYVLAGNTPVLVHNIGGSAGGYGDKCKLFFPGPHAGGSIPARSQGRNWTQDEIDQTNDNGDLYGCHTCGTKVSGYPKGTWVKDHQPVSTFVDPNVEQHLLPQCKVCSGIQGRTAAQMKRDGFNPYTDL